MVSARRLSAAALGLGIAVTAFAPSSASAAPKDAAAVCSGYLNVYSVNAPGYVDCMIGVAGATVGRVGSCTSAYQPFAPPFGTGGVAETCVRMSMQYFSSSTIRCRPRTCPSMRRSRLK